MSIHREAALYADEQFRKLNREIRETFPYDGVRPRAIMGRVPQHLMERITERVGDLVQRKHVIDMITAYVRTNTLEIAAKGPRDFEIASSKHRLIFTAQQAKRNQLDDAGIDIILTVKTIIPK